MAPVVKVLRAASGLDARVAVSAQHREMLDQVLALFGIEPDYDLDLMKPGQGLTEITIGVIAGMKLVLEDFDPDLVLVHGDTTTAFAAGLAAFYKKIPVAHVEAGLRTNNIYSPWPEEVNRKLVAGLASLHFAPTVQSRANLLAEGIPETNIKVTGNTVIDALLSVVSNLEGDESKSRELDRKLGIDRNKTLILVTGHRRESFGEGFKRICSALRQLADREDVQIIYPVHLNPSVKRPVEAQLGSLDRVRLVPPQDYLPFVHLMRRAHIILTDSGGIQEEAPSLGKPVLVMRNTTERPEGLDGGAIRLVGTDSHLIVREVTALIDDKAKLETVSRSHSPYGDGMASERIRDAITKFLSMS